MKKVLFSGAIFCLAAVAAYGQMGIEFGECPALTVIEGMLDLSDEQRAETYNLSQQYSKELNEHILKIREELNVKYAELARESLPDEQKKQFDGLLSAEETIRKAISSADNDYRTTLPTTRSGGCRKHRCCRRTRSR